MTSLTLAQRTENAEKVQSLLVEAINETLDYEELDADTLNTLLNFSAQRIKELQAKCEELEYRLEEAEYGLKHFRGF